MDVFWFVVDNEMFVNTFPLWVLADSENAEQAQAVRWGSSCLALQQLFSTVLCRVLCLEK